MYKKYRRLELDIYEFDDEDVIRTSLGDEHEGDDNPDDV